MIDIEIPVGKRTLKYRLFEMLPAVLSYGALLLLVILSLVSPTVSAIYLLVIIVTLLVKATGIAFRTIQGRNRLEAAQRVDWHSRLMDLQNPGNSFLKLKGIHSRQFGSSNHIENLRLMSADPESFPLPSDVYNAVIVATFNESYDVLAPTIESVMNSTFDSKKIILVFAYEQRGGEATKQTAERLQAEYKGKFYDFILVDHPDGLPNQIVGKGSNITHAGRFLQKWLVGEGISSKNVIVTTR